jgi:hypothetical protein
MDRHAWMGAVGPIPTSPNGQLSRMRMVLLGSPGKVERR